MQKNDRCAIDAIMQRTREFPLLKAEEELELGRRIAEGDKEALDLLVNSNVRLVVSIAKKYQSMAPMEDLIQEGILGLISAAKKYDYTMKRRFSTLATWWVRQQINRFLCDHNGIHVPAYLTGSVCRIMSAERELEKKLGRRPAADEIAEELGMSAEDVRVLQMATGGMSSLNASVGEEGDAELGDFIADDGRVEDNIDRKQLIEEVNRALAELSEREEKVIRLRFGMDGSKPLTLEETGRVMQVTRERARQIEGKALLKLRRAARLREMYREAS